MIYDPPTLPYSTVPGGWYWGIILHQKEFANSASAYEDHGCYIYGETYSRIWVTNILII